MNLMTTGVIHRDETGPYLLVVLRGVFDLAGTVRGDDSCLVTLAAELLLLRDDVFSDNAAMLCGEKSMMAVARRSMRHLDKSFAAIERAGVDPIEWSRLDSDEEKVVGPETVSSSIHV